MSDSALTTWSAFQSVFQLSIAMNVGFTALLTIFGHSAEREKAMIDKCVNLTSLLRKETNLLTKFEDHGNEIYIATKKNFSSRYIH
jgi:hypothetical protein